ncbi:MAG: enoyl-CoA hydratase/isomerase family protein [Alphaproteobacteria bacterium]|nr:MAG: enoyl-CoA hydratase/isomerase family protein [Alphaproteobacteria bacterium]
MQRPLFIEEIGDDHVARITLTRPEVHNAFNDTLIAELTTVLRGLGDDERVRAVVLAAQGRSFSAGADLNWMQRMAGYSEEENLNDARALAELMRTLNTLPKPTMALVQGPAYGGGVGLVACCDIAVAAQTANFCLSEVRLGLIPSVIAPYVVAAIGERAARRFFLTAESFTAEEARAAGLVHLVVPDEALEDAGARIVRALLRGGPQAQVAAKDLIFAVCGRHVDDALVEDTAQRIAHQRASQEGREGVAAFLEKRKPTWMKD